MNTKTRQIFLPISIFSVCRILFGADRMLIPAMVLMLTGFLILRRRLEDGETEEARR